MAEVCLPVWRANPGVIHVCKHTFQIICGSVHHSLEGLGSIGQAKGCEKIFKQAKGGDNCGFWDVINSNGYLVITLDKINF